MPLYRETKQNKQTRNKLYRKLLKTVAVLSLVPCSYVCLFVCLFVPVMFTVFALAVDCARAQSFTSQIFRGI